MLQSIREHTTGWIAGFIIALLVIPFALWGIGNYFSAQVATHVATVNGEEISQAEFQSEFSNFMQGQQNRLGEAFNPDDYSNPEVKQAFLEDMIRGKVLLQTAQEHGYTVSTQTLAQTIAADPAFQVNGEFNPQRYSQVLAQIGWTPQGWERRIREDLLVRSFPRALGTSSLATDQEVTDLLRLMGQTRSFDYILIDPKAFRDQVEVSSEEIKTYYQGHPDEFMTPETVSIRYLELSAEGLADGIAVDEAALRAYFEQNQTSYLTEEQRLASHILIQVPEDADEATEQAALERAQALVERLRSGADFAALAEAESEDIGSASSGGELGWIERGQMSSSFEEALFSLEVGEVSDPVRTSYGYHIIKLRDIQESTGQTFDEARAQVAADFKASEAERLFLERADRLVNLTYKTPSALRPAAEAMGLEIQTAGPFTREGAETGIASIDAVVETAYSDLVLKQDTNSDPVELGSNHIVVLRVSEHREPELKPLASVQDSIREQLIQNEAERLAQQRAEALVERLQSGDVELGSLAEEDVRTLVEAEAVTRNAKDYPPALLQGIFELPAPDNAVGYHALPAGESGYAVVALREIKPGPTEQMPEFQRRLLSQQVQQSYLAAELQALLDSLMAKADVEIAEERL